MELIVEQAGGHSMSSSLLFHEQQREHQEETEVRSDVVERQVPRAGDAVGTRLHFRFASQ